MCDVTGYFSYKNKIQPRKFYQAHFLLKHRGADDKGFVSLQNNQLELLRGNDSNQKASEQRHISESQEINLNKKVTQAYLDDCLLDYSSETFFKAINELESRVVCYE
jgi:glutamine phosphoribosylpyrophosphate amidotransferase